MKVHLSIDVIGMHEKPQKKYEIVKARERTSNNWREMELREAADLIGNKGYATIPGHMVGGLKASNCMGMQVFMLDFDDGTRFTDVKCKCEEIGLPISFAYHTLSSTEKKERFRVAFIYECFIEDTFITKVILKMLCSIFQECDSHCSNLDRSFWGGNELIYLNESAHLSLMQIQKQFLSSIDNNNNFSRNIESFCKKNKIMRYRGLPAMGNAAFLHEFLKNDGNNDSIIIHSIGKNEFSSFYMVEGRGCIKATGEERKKRRLEISEGSGCQMLDDFLSGEHVDHAQKFAILGNLMQINGGVKKFFEILETFYEDESVEKWKKDIKYMNVNLKTNCSDSFCPYYNTCEHMGSIVETIAKGRKIKRDEEKYFTLEEATECLERNLSKAYQLCGAGIHLIKAQTGLGKTTAYINLIKDKADGKFIIAAPTTMLKQEIYSRLLKAGIPSREIFMTTGIRGNPLIPKKIQDAVSAAHNRGEHDLPRKIVREYCHEIQEDITQKKVVEECKRYLAGVAAMAEERIIVTTHAYFMNMSETMLQEYTVIIDEDILQLYLLKQTAEVSISSLQVLAGKNLSPYSEIAKQMLHAKEGEYHRMPGGGRAIPLTTEELERMGCCDGSNINDMVYAGSFVKIRNTKNNKEEDYGQEVIYFYPRQLPKAKYIVFSATLNEEVYRKYFERKMDVYSYPYRKTRYRGKLVQYTYHSLGRKDLKDKKQVFSFAKKVAGDKRVKIITFLNMASLKEDGENNISSIHFGNSTGSNMLEGKDLVIIGTPYNIQEAYKLVACYLGADMNQKIDQRPKIRRITYNHASFIIMTYNDPLLREIQLYSIESELEQCIGRTRLLRHDCSVYVFSCFPCEQAELCIRNYLHGYGVEEQEGINKTENEICVAVK